MQSRRDHLQAYQFATGRLASALVSGDPGTGEAPMRRSGLGAAFGVMVTVLLLLASVVYGLLKPAGTTSWARPGALIVEKETGTRYIYARGQLHPTANYASALLALGGGTAVQQVSRAALADVPRGPALGIPGAPDDVAQPSALLTGGWADCLRPGTGGEALDFDPARARHVAGAARVLVAGPDGTRYVLWQGTKYQVKDRASLIALGLDTQQPVKATAAWLADVPAGTALGPAAIPGNGTGGRTVAGATATIGRLFRTTVGGTAHYYVLRADGMAPLTATESALLAAAPGGEPPRQVSPADIAAVPSSADDSLMHRVPDVLTGTDATADGGTALCLLHSPDPTRQEVTVVREDGPAASGPAVLVPPAHAVLAAPPGNATTTAESYLITDQGVKYRLLGQAAQALGYGGVRPRVLPDVTLRQIPSGPDLSRAQAAAAVPGAH